MLTEFTYFSVYFPCASFVIAMTKLIFCNCANAELFTCLYVQHPVTTMMAIKTQKTRIVTVDNVRRKCETNGNYKMADANLQLATEDLQLVRYRYV